MSHGEDIPTSGRHSANQKNMHLELMYGHTANVWPVISCNTIFKLASNKGSLWLPVYWCPFSIKLDGDERPEDLFQL